MSNTREKILKAAVAVFSEQGYKGATTKAIAKEAGVNESTLFRIFGTKDKLFHDLFSLGNFIKIIDILKQSTPSDDVEVQLTRIANLYKEMYQVDPHTTKMIFRCVIDKKELDYINQHVGNSAFGYLTEYLRKTDVDWSITPEEAAFFFLSMVHGSLQRRFIFEELDDVDMTHVVRIFLNGTTK